MSATVTSVTNGATIEDSSLGGLIFIPAQSTVRSSGPIDVMVTTPGQVSYSFTRDDFGEATAQDAVLSLVAALNAGGSTPVAAYNEYTATFTAAPDGSDVNTIEVANSWYTGTGAVTASADTGVEGNGLYYFDFPAGAIPDITKVVAFATLMQDDANSLDGPVIYAHPSTADRVVLSAIKSNTGARYLGSAPNLYCSITIRIYP